jgi:hypothetical protein
MSMTSLFSAPVRAIMRRFSRQLENRDAVGDMLPFDWEWEERRDAYSEWAKLHANTVYDDAADGGSMELILTDVIGREESSGEMIVGYENPLRAICEAYQNVFRGVWGRDFWPMSADGDEMLQTSSGLYRALAAVWKESSLDNKKQVMQTFAPLFGTVGLRISAYASTGVARIAIDHPGRIVDFDEDEDGRCTAVLLEYSELAGPLGRERRVDSVRDFMDDRIIRRERNGNLEFEVQNALGVCPYVVLRHSDTGGEFGAPAFFGSEKIIHHINWRITRQDTCVDRNEFPTWFITGSGDAPERISLTGDHAIYCKTDVDVPSPTVNAMTPNIQHGEHRAFYADLIERLKSRQPELILNDLKALSGQSGETIAQLLKPVAQRIELARSNYEHAVIRAMKIAVAWKVLLGAADVGSGSGNTEAAIRSLSATEADWTFNARSALPESPFDVVKREEAETWRRSRNIADASAAVFVSEREKLRIAGYDEKRIADIEKEVGEQDVIPTDDADDVPFQGADDADDDPAENDASAR